MAFRVQFRGLLAAASLALIIPCDTGHAHWPVFSRFRAGAPPTRPGGGWRGECFLDLPDQAAKDLLAAERYTAGRVPDFTFRTDWIDFPAGPKAVDVDTAFATVGDFLNDYIYEVSAPAKLNEPFGHLLIRFQGMLKVAWEDNADEQMFVPVWVDVACNGYDGFRFRTGDVGFRLPIVDPADAFYWEHFFYHAMGLFPVEFTMFNRYDPDPESNFGRAGIEVYTLHGGGLPWPAGAKLIHSRLGQATIVPPRVIYQPEDVLPITIGDFDTDADFDFRDFHWLQNCFSGPYDEEIGPVLAEVCEWMDFDGDSDVDVADAVSFLALLGGP